ncbi:D-alanine--D-alanine ligase [Komagataeibacter rhaeticus]|uniref:ATP-grasp domain-containing protein n=1 Tax=Komagataeibacter rhaeticus TaxID=215221 RepID=UPI0004D59815|nr:ATP-grasp domain-containing protein [Komagataeibacter rhaeticus]KDU96963.1 D-alanine--D-alanine ligase [Komagataeibacter rhaeticus AF1]MBL7238811.1 ATP-grasp domain-containing protein [Komagataeibacter rhaeticus]PYD52942.1 D-alanine--D-alanine ligase [Komagataeibacter rhaeticus]GBQ11702.1 D-alanine--D-alanine ligase [Komagataeibacter rhaeticus DSM 16663]
MTDVSTAVDSRATATKAAPTVSAFEFWPGWIFYTPIVLYWIILGLWYRDFSLPTAANPRIETGGLCGESKSSILDMAGDVARRWIAPYAVLTTGADDTARALAAMDGAGLSFPVVLKPDIGCNGTGVRIMRDVDSLTQGMAAFGRGVPVMLQHLIPYGHEVGIFYIRHPDQKNGRITSLTYKEVPCLTGDGHSTVEELLHADARTRLVPHIYIPRLRARLAEVPPAGQSLPLVFAGNHCKGSIFHDRAIDITPALEARVNEIMRDIPDFHFGRIDAKARSLATLREGEDFQIIEINGVGSEATHIWDARTTLRHAYATQFMHYRETFRIGAKKRREGWKSSGAMAMLRAWLRQRRLMASYPLND